MIWRLHRRYAYPLWWSIEIATWEWALPMRVYVRPRLTDGSGRREHVIVVDVSLLCLHWSVHYAWGRRRYHPPPERVLSLLEVLKRDLEKPLTHRHDDPTMTPEHDSHGAD
jgi:hypothetical protein